MERPDEKIPPGFPSTLTIKNRACELDKVASWLGKISTHYKLSERAIFKLDLVLNEALPNIISYSYQDNLDHEINIRLDITGCRIVLEIIDDGIAFDPFSENSYQESTSLESASETGRGLHLINNFTDEQEYQRIGDNNHMRVIIFNATGKNQ
jgi:anti-sigma regulatory factor (Ser/Thr protein kinase)